MNRVVQAWEWLESTASLLLTTPSVILGDLNVGLKSGPVSGGESFRRILRSGWHRAVPDKGASFFSGQTALSKIDHILGTPMCEFSNARYVANAESYISAGNTTAISDHAALVANVKVLTSVVLHSVWNLSCDWRG